MKKSYRNTLIIVVAVAIFAVFFIHPFTTHASDPDSLVLTSKNCIFRRSKDNSGYCDRHNGYAEMICSTHNGFWGSGSLDSVVTLFCSPDAKEHKIHVTAIYDGKKLANVAITRVGDSIFYLHEAASNSATDTSSATSQFDYRDDTGSSS